MTDEKKQFPWMPEYVDETLALAATLSLEQLGAYVRLRAHAWKQEPGGSLPADEEELAILSGLGERWATVGKVLRRMLKPLEGTDRLVMPEVSKRHTEQVVKHLVRSTNGGQPPREGSAPRGRPKKQPEKLGESSGFRQLSSEVSSLSLLNSVPAGRTENREPAKAGENLSLSDTGESQYREPDSQIDVLTLAASAQRSRWQVDHPDEYGRIVNEAEASITPTESVWRPSAVAAIVDKAVMARMSQT